MHTTGNLEFLAQEKPSLSVPVILIYCRKTSPRLEYVCRFIFLKVLRCRYEIIEDVEKFKATTGFKLNYSGIEVPDVLQVTPEGLLHESNIREAKPTAELINGITCFFATNKAADFPFDIFSAVFYFISRYEEWQGFEADQHKRFETKASLQFKYKCHLIPFVDQWINLLAKALEKKYPAFRTPAREFKVISTIDVDNLYAYKSKGLWRALGASAKDVLRLNFANIRERTAVLLAGKKDPFDIYEEISAFCKSLNIPLFYFFLFRNGTAHDRTINPSSPAFVKVFKEVKTGGAFMGLHPSYDAAFEDGLLNKEVKAITEASSQAIHLSRQHYLRFNIRSTPNLLLAEGIRVDFSMGFASTPGFRAGTSYPFFYYDFNAEKETELLFVPFCVMDGVYTVYQKQSPQVAFDAMLELALEVKKTGGYFISVFHERTFSDVLYKGFGKLYKELHVKLNRL